MQVSLSWLHPSAATGAWNRLQPQSWVQVIFGCPQPEVTQQWPVTPRCHLSSHLPQTTISHTAKNHCNKNVVGPCVGPNLVFDHLHLAICGSDDINKIGGLLPLLQVNRGAWALSPECIVELSCYVRKAAHFGISLPAWHSFPLYY